MKISFLVTYYNQEKYVRQSMDSILAIDKPCDWEILVGDDGSSDGTTDVVRTYMEQYPDNIFLYVMDREAGKAYEVVRRASANRINLVEHMTGDYFCILDGDDFYCAKDFVSKALALYQADATLSAVGFGYKTFSAEKGDLKQYVLAEGAMSAAAYLRMNAYTPGGACVFKNCMNAQMLELLHQVGYYDDNDITLFNLRFGRLYGVKQVIYSYRQTENSVYNSMQEAEQHVLNAQGFDADRLLLPNHDRLLMERYGLSLLKVWFFRRRLPTLLGEKWNRYLSGCSQIPGSVTYQMLCSEKRTAEGKRIIRNTIGWLVWKHPILALRLLRISLRKEQKQEKL